MTTVRRDFFLDPSERLTEQERALMTAMLHDLVAVLAAAILAAAGGNAAEPEPSKIAATLGRAGLLDRRNLIRLMLRRADEQRILTAFAGHAGPRRLPLLPRLVSDGNSDVAAAAMRWWWRADGVETALASPASTSVTSISAMPAHWRMPSRSRSVPTPIRMVNSPLLPHTSSMPSIPKSRSTARSIH